MASEVSLIKKSHFHNEYAYVSRLYVYYTFQLVIVDSWHTENTC